jgi:hypothetical protein
MRQRGKWIPVLGVVIGITNGCAGEASPPGSAAAEVMHTTPKDGGDDLEPPGSAAAEITNTPPEDRADCLEPPWTPDGSSSGLRVSQCADERVYRLVLGDGSPASGKAEERFLNAHRDAFHAVDGIVSSGYGLCCFEDEVDQDALCLAFGLRLCSTPLPDFIDVVRKLQAADDGVAGHSLRIAVELQGPSEPRCDASDDDCGPIPYSDQGAQTPPKTRSPVYPPKPDSLPCSHDGECVVNGCGNECDQWTLGGAPGQCPYITELEGAFCGCVEDRCAWFH